MDNGVLINVLSLQNHRLHAEARLVGMASWIGLVASRARMARGGAICEAIVGSVASLLADVASGARRMARARDRAHTVDGVANVDRTGDTAVGGGEAVAAGAGAGHAHIQTRVVDLRDTSHRGAGAWAVTAGTFASAIAALALEDFGALVKIERDFEQQIVIGVVDGLSLPHVQSTGITAEPLRWRAGVAHATDLEAEDSTVAAHTRGLVPESGARASDVALQDTADERHVEELDTDDALEWRSGLESWREGDFFHVVVFSDDRGTLQSSLLDGALEDSHWLFALGRSSLINRLCDCHVGGKN